MTRQWWGNRGSGTEKRNGVGGGEGAVNAVGSGRAGRVAEAGQMIGVEGGKKVGGHKRETGSQDYGPHLLWTAALAYRPPYKLS